MTLVERRVRTVVVGIGNTIRGDDGVGIRLVRKLRGSLPPQFEIKESATAGFELLDFILGYDRAVLVDAVQTPGGVAGQVYRFPLQEYSRSSQLPFSHSLTIRQLVEIGRVLGGSKMPAVEIVAVEAKQINDFSETLSPELEDKLDGIAEAVRSEIEKIG